MSFHSRPGKSRALDMSYFLAQVMSKFTGNFGMTFAKKWTYRAPEICQNGNESTFWQNIGNSHFKSLQTKTSNTFTYNMCKLRIQHTCKLRIKLPRESVGGEKKVDLGLMRELPLTYLSKKVGL